MVYGFVGLLLVFRVQGLGRTYEAHLGFGVGLGFTDLHLGRRGKPHRRWTLELA